MVTRVTQHAPVRPPGAMLSPEYQELKISIHRNLLNRVYLQALSSMSTEEIRMQVCAAVARSLEAERSPLRCMRSPLAKQRLIDEILDEVRALSNITEAGPGTAAGRTFARLAQTAAGLFGFPK